MIKTYLKRGYIGLSIFFFFFVMTYILLLVNLKSLAKLTIYGCLPAILYAMYYINKYIYSANKKILKRLKNKEPIFTDDLLEDKDENSKSEK